MRASRLTRSGDAALVASDFTYGTVVKRRGRLFAADCASRTMCVRKARARARAALSRSIWGAHRGENGASSLEFRFDASRRGIIDHEVTTARCSDFPILSENREKPVERRSGALLRELKCTERD